MGPSIGLNVVKVLANSIRLKGAPVILLARNFTLFHGFSLKFLIKKTNDWAAAASSALNPTRFKLEAIWQAIAVFILRPQRL
jgi:hypothetical protein